MGPYPWLFVNRRSSGPHPWLLLWYGKEGEGRALRHSPRTYPARRRHATSSSSCVGDCCRGLFLATVGNGPEPKTKRSEVLNLCRGERYTRLQEVEMQAEGNIGITKER